MSNTFAVTIGTIFLISGPSGKSITALLFGVAIKEGLINSLDQSVYSLFSEEKNPIMNEDYKKIKLRDVLDMSSGLDADSDDWNSPGVAGKWFEIDDCNGIKC